MLSVAAFMMTVGFFAAVMSGAMAKAVGLKSMPAMKSTLSRTISSWASCLARSGLGPDWSRRMTTILVPSTVSPCSRI